MKAYTSLEQSKKLTDILPLESADMQWIIDGLGEPFPFPVEDKVNENEEPCWSLAALMNLLPSEFTTKGETTYKIDIRKYALTDDVDIYQIAYGNYKWHEDGSHSWSDMINTGEREELIDACYDIIISLHEFELM